MAWEKLKQSLQKMPPSGAEGFEGFATKLLELVFGEKFIVARSGDQPSGDAHNTKRSVCLQAKRYSDASPDAKTIEGDFDQSLRSLPNTDIYVLAITRDTAQLDDTLDAMGDKSGVEIVVWDFENEHSDLAVLCIAFWEQLFSFECIKSLDHELQPWIIASRKTQGHQDRIKSLQIEIRECTQTFTTVQTAAQSFLGRRFDSSKDADLVALFSIDLNRAVQRTGYQKKILEWWEAAKQPIITLRGDEGMGKTWLAAQCVQRLSQQNALVLWLESLNWHNCESFEKALIEAVARLKIGDANKSARLVKKIRNQWSFKTLIVLDGVNERGALNAAQRILDDLIAKEMGQCRILFTTRQLDNVSGYEQSLWKRWPELPVERFDDEEFKAALSGVFSPVQLSDIPEKLAAYARIPRYFQTCIKLRNKLKTFDVIDLPLVLWTDLLDKISGAEPQLRVTLGWTDQKDAIEVLVTLAKNAPDDSNQGIAQELLNRCFAGKYNEVRHYLKEIRIFEESGIFEAKVDAAHIVLGKALFLRALLQGLQDKPISEISDRLKKELEPLADEDGSTEALFVALQLSALQDTAHSPVLAKLRAALLHAWLFSHNSNPVEDRLKFWVENDISAYAEFIETFFENSYDGDAQCFVVKPLAVHWKANGSQSRLLKPYLDRWLLLVWFTECPAGKFEYQGYCLPVAARPDQVRLTAIALSILSLRTDNDFLKTLALCHATDSQTWKTFKARKGEEKHKHHFKSVQNTIAILMRWGYTEKVMPILENLAKQHSEDQLLMKGLKWLARLLRTVEVPAILELSSEDLPKYLYLGEPAINLIRQKRPLFIPKEERVEGEPFLSEHDFAYLAIRTDLPPLLDEDVAKIIKAVEKMCADEIIMKGSGHTWEDHQFEAWWPWYAKFKPKEIPNLVARLHLNALSQERPYSLFRFFESIPAALDEKELSEWMALAILKYKNEAKTFRDVDHLAPVISEAALLSLSEEYVHEWIVSAGSHGVYRCGMFFNPISELIPYLIPKKTSEFAIQKCFKITDKSFGPIDGPVTEFGYWCYIASLTAEPNKEVFKWATDLLMKCDTARERPFSLLRLWFRSAPPQFIESAIGDSETENFFDQQAMRAWAFSGNLSFDSKLVSASYETLIKRLPKGFAGTILTESARDADLKLWGDELFGIAFNCIGKSPISKQSRAKTKLILGKGHAIKWMHFEYDDSRPRGGTSNVSSWGVNQTGMGEMLKTHSEFERSFEQEFEKWKSDENALHNWAESDLHAFGAWKALDAYRKLNPKQYAEKTHLLLERALGDLHLQFHIGGFLYAITTILLSDQPEQAWHYFQKLNSGSLGISVSNDIGVPAFYSYLWNLKVCFSEKHKELRLYLFEECQNEFETMALTVAALVNKAETELFEIVEKLLANDLAKNRALAVSVLTWMGCEKSNTFLEQLKESDSSTWVRGHAEWALEVGLQEQNAREHFRTTLNLNDPFLVAAALQVLKPALTPVARWWQVQIRDEEEKKGLVLNPKSVAVIESFLSHWTNINSSSVSVAGKKLEEYSRGERLDTLRTPRIAPWWNL